MLRTALLIALIYVAFVAETVGLNVTTSVVQPQWLALAAMLLVWSLSPSMAVTLAGVCGLLEMSVGNHPLWIGPLLYGSVGWILVMAIRRWRMQSVIALFSLTLLFCVTADTGLDVIRQLLGELSIDDWNRHLVIAGGRGVATGLAAVLLVLLVRTVMWGATVVTPATVHWQRKQLSH